MRVLTYTNHFKSCLKDICFVFVAGLSFTQNKLLTTLNLRVSQTIIHTLESYRETLFNDDKYTCLVGPS